MGQNTLAFMGIWIVGLLVLMYFTTILPGKKKNKQVREMHDSVTVGDRIVTIGGILGTVLERKDDELRIRVDDETDTTMWIIIHAVQLVRSKANEE